MAAGVIGCDCKHLGNGYGSVDWMRLQSSSSVSSFIKDMTKIDGISKKSQKMRKSFRTMEVLWINKNTDNEFNNDILFVRMKAFF